MNFGILFLQEFVCKPRYKLHRSSAVLLHYWKIYLIHLRIFMLIINQRNTYFFSVKFYEKSKHIAKSNLYCTYSRTYTHIYIYRPK